MSFLHNDRDLFKRVVLTVKGLTGISESAIEKDYYVFMLLKEIRKENPDAVFKGGTSLSKGYGIIKRFSEDIDLNAVPSNPLSEAKRRSFNNSIFNAYNKLGLLPDNYQYKSRSDFVCFKASYNPIFSSSYLTDYIKVESVLRRRGRVLTYKLDELSISNYIYDYLIQYGDKYNEFVENFDLIPFKMYVQNYKYTFAEKLISIGNNYLRGKSERLSRHLYDVYKLASCISIDTELKGILLEVVKYTKERDFDDAIIKGNNLEDSIYKALKDDFYKQDYTAISNRFIYERVSYEDCKRVLSKIISTGLCDTSTDSESLKDLFLTAKVVDKNGRIKYYEVATYNGLRFTLGKEGLLKYKDRFCNVKVTSDLKVLPKFGDSINVRKEI